MLRNANTRTRDGSTSLSAVIAIPVLLLAAGIVIYLAFLRDTRTEAQTGADASALASARALATDDMLTTEVSRAQKRLDQARAAALVLGQANSAAGRPFTIDPNTEHDPDGDIVFGRVERPMGGIFEAVSPDPAEWVGARINAVRVTTRRAPVRSAFGVRDSNRDILGQTIAMLDFSVAGFRPNDDKPIPLVPIGIFTDHKGEVAHAWDTHLRQHRDLFQFNAETKQLAPGPDGIPEVSIVLGPRQTGAGEVPAVFLQVGVHTFEDTLEQVRSGVTRSQLAEKLGSGFVLGEDNILTLPGSPECPLVGQAGRQPIDEVFSRLLASGEPRLWPLFTEVDEDEGLVRVNGWVGARVVAIEKAPGGGVKLTLQLAVVCHTSTVTEQRTTKPAFWANNRTVCRVRLAE